MAASRQTGGSGGLLTGVLHPDGPGQAVRFDGFIRAQYRGLVQFLRGRTATLQDAEDAAQESVAKLLRYRASAAASDWQRLLYRIAINAAHDRFRDAQHHPVEFRMAPELHEIASPDCSPDEFAAHAQKLVRLRRALLELPPRCQRVCLLKLVYDMTNAQIAGHCGVSVKMVEKHLARGLATLRKKVGNSGAGTFK